MRNVRFVLVLVLVAGMAHRASGASCSFQAGFAAASAGEQNRILQSFDPKDVDEACIRALVQALPGNADQVRFDLILGAIERWSAVHGFSLSLLVHCAERCRASGDTTAGKRITALWERRNKPLVIMADQLQQSGRLDGADSLFMAFDRCVRLGFDTYLSWASLQSLRHSYGEAARLCCRAIKREPRLTGFALNRLDLMLDHAPRDSMRLMLATFEQCAHDLPGVDTIMILRWIANEYARRDFGGEEIEILQRFPASDAATTSRLLDVARVRMLGGNCAQAMLAAYAAYARSPRDQEGKAAARVLCQCLAARNKLDSALLWLERADLSSEHGAVEATVLYQRAGRLREAAAMIDRLRKPIVRDTLLIRQKLFVGDPVGAQAFFSDAVRGWNTDRQTVLMWRARLALFAGNIEMLGQLLDSVSHDEQVASHRELLDYRYHWNELSRFRDGLALWAQIEYDLYLRNTARVIERLKRPSLAADLRSVLVRRVVRTMQSRGETDALILVVEALPDPLGDPEMLYWYAEALAASEGGKAKAVELLNKVIGEFPTGLFTQRARVLLAFLRAQS